MTKKILLSIASAFLALQSYKILAVIHTLETESWGLLLFIAWIINLIITGIFAFLVFAFPTQKLLPQSYYTIHSPNRLKKIYDLLQVDLFRKVLLATLWKSQKQRKKYFNGQRNGITNLTEQSMKSEFGHLVPFVILCLVSTYLLLIGKMKLGTLTLLINIIGNLYPVLLQRYHRMRILAIRKRRSQ
jgi:hypothetical protein